MQKIIPKLNSSGISHLLIPLIVVVIGVAGIGTYMKVNSSARSNKPDWPRIIFIEGHENLKVISSHRGKDVVVTDLKVTLGAYRNDMGYISKVTIANKRADRVSCEPWGKDQQCDYAVRLRGDQRGNAHKTNIYVEKSSHYRKHGLFTNNVSKY